MKYLILAAALAMPTSALAVSPEDFELCTSVGNSTMEVAKRRDMGVPLERALTGSPSPDVTQLIEDVYESPSNPYVLNLRGTADCLEDLGY